MPVLEEWHTGNEMLASLSEYLRHVTIEVDLLVMRSVRVWVDALSVMASRGPGMSLIEEGPFAGRDDDPIFALPLDDIPATLGYVCDGNPDLDESRDPEWVDPRITTRNDCPLACQLATVGRATVCPIVDRGGDNFQDCDPIASFNAQLTDIRNALSGLVFRLGDVQARWIPSPEPGDRRPVLDLSYRLNVSLTLRDELEYFVDIVWTYVDGHVLLPFEPGPMHCAVGSDCDGGTCPAANSAPATRWEGFEPWSFAATWGTHNLRMAAPLDAEAYPAYRMRWDWRSWTEAWVWEATILYYLTGLWVVGGVADMIAVISTDRPITVEREGHDFTVLEPANILDYLEFAQEEAHDDALGAMRDLTRAVARFVHGYLSFLPPILEPDPPGRPWYQAGTLEMTEANFNYLRVLGAPYGAVRLIEGSAGASRLWWNALGGPLDQVNRLTEGARFEFVGVGLEADAADGTDRLRFDVISDLDCDTAPDHVDGCPTYRNTTGTADSDGDTISDFCDLCAFFSRRDLHSALPRRSFDYNRSPGDGPAVVGDSDGDDVGDHCDLCPRLSTYDLPGGSRSVDEATIPAAGGPSTVAGGTSAHPYDFDRDGIGDRCDNCEHHPNRDQWNCNAADERADGRLAEPPRPDAKGVGDACDWMPCVDSCGVASAEGNVEPEIEVPFDTGEGWFVAPDEEPLQAFVCPVGSVSAADPGAVTLRTKVRGCYCDEIEYRNAVAGSDSTCFDTNCRDDGQSAGRWTDAAYGGRRWEYGLYSYSQAYRFDRSAGLAGKRFSNVGLREYYRPAGSAESTDRVTEQEWNWISQPEFSPGAKYVRMWFKPDATPLRFDGYDNPYGNTYTGWTWVNPVGIRLRSGVAEPPPVGGGTSITSPWEINEDGMFAARSSPLLDILERWCYAADCWGWPDSLFFDDEPDTEVVGLAVSGFDPHSARLSWVVGTKLATGSVFELKDFAAAFAYDANRDPNRYWIFGGRDAANRATDQMWAAQLAVLDEVGTKTYVGSEGMLVPLSSGPLPEGTTAFFEASPVHANGPWPSERAGATLVCAGSGSGPATTPGQLCDGFCPNVDVALGLATPPDGVVRPAGRLLLVGGEGPTGPLDDIWVYDEQASWRPPADVAPGETGPWPSGWSLVGILPGAGEGLAHAGSVQVGHALWLVGGRTSLGTTADVVRVDLDTGEAERIPAAGFGLTPRMAPAVTYDARRNGLVVYGGTDAFGRGLTDLWSFDLGTRTWTSLGAPCTGSHCPPATGRETLYLHPRTREPTVIANRTTATASTLSWSMRSGLWESAVERSDEAADCNGDTAPEWMFGARCSTGSGGFPDYGRLRCDGGRLVCRPPVAPGSIAWEPRMHGVRAMARDDTDLLVLAGDRIEEYRFGPDGYPALERMVRLRRAGHDLAVAPGAWLVADDAGVSVYSEADGALLAAVQACGRVRRVFVDGTLAVVVGLRSIATVDLSEPSAPVVLARFRLLPFRDHLEIVSCSGCGWFERSIDRLCDGLGACGAFGRSAAAYSDHRLFVELLGVLYVLDFGNGLVPEVGGTVPVGLATDMAVEGRHLYVNLPGRQTAVVAQVLDGSWARVGEHDVRAWVEGVTDVRQWAVRWDRGRLQVAGRQ
ncbi:MAG: hypothetical protein GYA57_18295 [Myxococcales bacterium]|nr:hypothetical protein [Myxococcales bacterium]